MFVCLSVEIVSAFLYLTVISVIALCISRRLFIASLKWKFLDLSAKPAISYLRSLLDVQAKADVHS